VKAGAPSSKDDDSEIPKDWTLSEKPKLRFDDIAGLDDVKEQIRIKMIFPFTFPEKAKKYKVKTGGGILLYGPPGTGKTMIAKAVAASSTPPSSRSPPPRSSTSGSARARRTSASCSRRPATARRPSCSSMRWNRSSPSGATRRPAASWPAWSPRSSRSSTASRRARGRT
jgi:hypothetical protein